MATSMFYGATKKTFQLAAFLRNNLTPTEKKLWTHLSNNSLKYRFRCQHPLSRYVVDFYCHFLKLVIEVDGSIHLRDEIHENDMDRENNLKEFGLLVIRFTNEEVLHNLDAVVQKIIDTMILRSKQIPPEHDLSFRESG